MKWTTKPPNAPGFYFFRAFEDPLPEVLWVEIEGEGSFVIGEEEWVCAEYEGEWSDEPIPEPGEA